MLCPIKLKSGKGRRQGGRELPVNHEFAFKLQPEIKIKRLPGYSADLGMDIWPPINDPRSMLR